MALPADFMQRLADTHGDPSAFSELVFGSPLHKGQRRYAENANGQVNFLLPGNSFGKTEFIMRYAVYLAWFKEGPYRPTTFEEWITQEYKGLIASYFYDIAKESFDRLEIHLRTREELKALVKRVTRSDPVEIELTNGSIITWGSLADGGKHVEAARRRFVMVDEAGHIPDLSTTFDNILFPRTMGVGGRIHLFGTPKPHSDPYLLEVYEKGRHGGDGFYYSQDGSAFENEFWPDEEKERILQNPRYVKGWEPCPDGGCEDVICEFRGGEHPILSPMGKQVIYGHFLLAGGYFFNRFHVARLFTGDYEVEWHGENHFHASPQPGRLYLGAFDLGGNKLRKRRKKGSDATVGFVIDYTERPWKIVCYDYIEGGEADWQDKYELMAKRFRDYPMPYLLIDATGSVDSVQEALQDRGVEVQGIQFGGNSNKKIDMLRNLQLVMELEWDNHRGVLRSPLIPKLKYELDHYVLPDDDIEQDTVMALGMVCHEICQWEMPSVVSGPVY